MPENKQSVSAATQSQAARFKRIHEVLQVERWPSAIALTDHDGANFTYAEIDALSVEMAAMLGAHGIRPGDRVLLLAENSVTFIVALFALSRLDAWAILANARLTAAEVGRLMSQADARAAIFTPEASPASAEHAALMDGVELGRLCCGVVLASPPRDTTPEPVIRDAGQTAVLIYTSGTVGAPKGVMLSHENLLFVCHAGAVMRHIGPDDVLLAVLPGTHVFGLSSVFMSGLISGARLVCMPRFDAATVMRQLGQGVTVLTAVPQIFANLLRHIREHGLGGPYPRLRYLYAGGSPLDAGLKHEAEQVFSLPLHNGYGQTEAAPSIAATRIEDPRTDAAVGPPLVGVEVVIDHPDAQGVGEVWVRGPNVMKGYFRNPEATRATLTPEGFLKTGDLGRFDEGGALHLVGRSKELIIHSGFNVYPPEVESVLTAHPEVTHAAVIGRPRDGNEDVLAFVTTSGPVTEAELRGWVRERIAGYKVPARIIIADALPQAATGKIMKNRLLDHFEALFSERD